MIGSQNLTVTIGDSSVSPGELTGVPRNITAFLNDGQIRALTNFDALDAAIPDDEEYQGLADSAAQILGGIVYGLVGYLNQGKSPVRVNNYKVAGRLTDAGWVLIVPACGVIMRCDSTLSYGSQVFEFFPEYLSDVTEKLRLDLGYSLHPWYAWESFWAPGTEASLPVVEGFWTLHVKTAEVI